MHKHFIGLFLVSLMRVAFSQPSPVAHYPFDGDAMDASGNANHGTAFGAVLTTDRFGNANSAYLFDGIDDYIDFLNNQSFRPSLPVTMAAWVMISDYGPNRIFANDYLLETYAGVVLHIPPAGRISTFYGDGGMIGPPWRRSKLGVTQLQLNTWYHVAAVIRGPMDMDLYVNGVNDCGTYSGSGGGLGYTTSPVGNAGRNDNLNGPSALQYYHGKIDDLRLYDQALDIHQIRAIMGNYNPVALDTTICEGDALLLTSYQVGTSYQWSPANSLSCTSCASPTATPTDTTTYTLIRGIGGGCFDTTYYILNVEDCCPTLSWSTLFTTGVSCNGAQDGQIQVNALGAAPLSYAVNGGPWQSNGTFSGLMAGSYVVSVLDSSQCQIDTLLTIDEPSPLTLTYTPSMVDCHGDSTGSVVALSTGGTLTYQYALNGGTFQSSGSFGGLPAGTHTLAVRDANGCQIDTALDVIDPPLLLAGVDPSNTWQQPNCAGDSNGVLSFLPSGGVAPYQLIFDGQPSSLTINGIPAGNYVYQLNDANGCLVEDTLMLGEPQPLQLNLDSLLEVDCSGSPSGQIFLSAIGGNGNYQFWLNGILGSGNFDSLFIGNYDAWVSDALGCEDSLAVQITGTNGLFVQVIDQENVGCHGDSTGSLTLQASGGTPPYQYASGGNVSLSNLISNLGAGSGLVQTQDANGCIIALPYVITEPDSLIAQVGPIVGINCQGDSSGIAYLNGMGGVPPYQYSMDGVSFQSSFALVGYPGGEHLGHVQDSNGCLASVTVVIDTLEAVNAEVDVISEYHGYALRCYGDSSGAVQAMASLGQPPYQYEWNQGGNSDTLVGLPAGNYLVTVRDSVGCDDTASVTLKAPPVLDGQAAPTSEYGGFQVRCFGDQNGSAAITGSGGVPPYQYRWSNGMTTDSLRNLPAGAYAAWITDANGCLSLTDTLILSSPPSLLVTAEVSTPTCEAYSDGQIQVISEGGVEPYEYTWDNLTTNEGALLSDLTEGIYTASVIDANGCIKRKSWQLNDPPGVDLTIDLVVPAGCDENNGSLMVTAYNGNGAPFRYEWSDGPTSSTRRDLDSGDYIVEVTDRLGCKESFSVTIVRQAAPEAIAKIGAPDSDGTILLSQAQVQFLNLSRNAVAYEWEFGYRGQRSLAFAPGFVYPEVGRYQVVLTAWDEYYRCPDRDTLWLDIVPNGQLYLPNAFTPNRDGRNDQFLVVGEGIRQAQLVIYSRWGREVWRGEGMPLAWEGISQGGHPVPEGVYVYRLRATFNDGREVDQSGTVMLLR